MIRNPNRKLSRKFMLELRRRDQRTRRAFHSPYRGLTISERLYLEPHARECERRIRQAQSKA